MAICWISFSLAVLVALLSSAAVHSSTVTQDEYIRNITGVDFTDNELNQSLALYTESELYRVAGSVCRVVAATWRAEGVLERPEHVELTDEQLAKLRLMVVVGDKVQETACTWMNAMFGDVVEENGECSVGRFSSFCRIVHIVNTYLDIYHSG